MWRQLSRTHIFTHTHRQTFVAQLKERPCTQPVWLLEDVRTLGPVLSVFGLPVSAPVDVDVLSRRIVHPLLEPQWLVALDVLP